MNRSRNLKYYIFYTYKYQMLKSSFQLMQILKFLKHFNFKIIKLHLKPDAFLICCYENFQIKQKLFCENKLTTFGNCINTF